MCVESELFCVLTLDIYNIYTYVRVIQCVLVRVYCVTHNLHASGCFAFREAIDMDYLDFFLAH